MAVAQETIRMTGIRCERCVERLAVALRSHEGIESASANLVGDVTLAWDAARTSRSEILEALAKAGFREAPAHGE